MQGGCHLPLSHSPAILAAPPDPGPGGGRGGQLLHHRPHPHRRPLRGRPTESHAQRVLLRHPSGQVCGPGACPVGSQKGMALGTTDRLPPVFSHPCPLQWSGLHCWLQSEGHGWRLALGSEGESGLNLEVCTSQHPLFKAVHTLPSLQEALPPFTTELCASQSSWLQVTETRCKV